MGFLTNLIGGGTIKWIIIGLASLIIVTTITVTIKSHFKTQENIVISFQKKIKSKDDFIKTLEEQVSGLTIDLDRATLSNKSLETEIDTLRESLERSIEETKRILISEGKSEDRIRRLEKAIADKVRQDRINAIRNGRKSELLLRFINKNVECFIVNFDKLEGTCIQGKWIMDKNKPKG